MFEDRFHFFGEGVRTLQGRCIGELNIQIEIPLVFGGKEPGRQSIPNQKRGTSNRGKEREAHDHFSDKKSGNTDIAICCLLEEAIESSEHPGQETVGVMAGLEQQRAKGWTQRQRVEGRDENRNGNRYRELLIETARNARDECRWNKYGRQD